MSSMPAPPLIKRREHLVEETKWGEVASVYEMTTEIEAGDADIPRSPIVVNRDTLEIDSASLDIGKVYSFEYLGGQMVLWKLPSGAVDLFEIVEE